MTTKRQDIIDCLDVGDAMMTYMGKEIFIDPRTQEGTGKMRYLLCYKDFEGYFNSYDELFSAKVIDGKCLNEICNKVILL